MLTECRGYVDDGDKDVMDVDSDSEEEGEEDGNDDDDDNSVDSDASDFVCPRVPFVLVKAVFD